MLVEGGSSGGTLSLGIDWRRLRLTAFPWGIAAALVASLLFATGAYQAYQAYDHGYDPSDKLAALQTDAVRTLADGGVHRSQAY